MTECTEKNTVRENKGPFCKARTYRICRGELLPLHQLTVGGLLMCTFQCSLGLLICLSASGGGTGRLSSQLEEKPLSFLSLSSNPL